MAFSRAASIQLLRRPTVISGSARNSACFASMAFGPSHGSRPRVSNSPSIIRRLLAARDGRLWIGTDKGLVNLKDGKLTHYPKLDGQSVLRSLRIVKEQCGPAGLRLQLGDSQSRAPATSATERTAVSATECFHCMRTAEAISGREPRLGCGDGSLVLRSSIRFQIRVSPIPKL
jgi:hypothetical protein